MPKIQEFDAGNLALRPTEIGVDATAAAARRIGAFYNQKGESLSTLGQRAGGAIRDAGDAAVSFMDHREISAGAANGASLISDLNNQWNAATKTADPSDPSVAGKFREEVLEPRLEQFKSGFTTEKSQAWAEHFVDGYRQHMFQKTTADMSKLAGDAAHVNAEKTRNALVNATYNDPSTLDFARDALGHSLDGIAGSSPNLTPEARSKVRQELTFKGEQELVHAAITGTIIKGGDWKTIANDPKNAPYINRPEIEQFERAQKAVERRDRIEQKQLEIANRQETDHAVAGAINDIYTNSVKVDDQGNYNIRPNTVKQLFDLHGKFPSMSKEAQAEISSRINWIESKQREKKEAARSDPATRADFLRRMDDDTNPLRQSEIWQAEAEHKLTPQDGAIMRGWQTSSAQSKELAPARKDFLTRMQPSIDPGKAGGLPTALGQTKMQEFEMDLRRKEKELGAQARSLYDPTSPNYFGKKENIAKYHVTMKQEQEYQKELAVEPKPPETVSRETDRPLRPIPSRAIQSLKNNPSARDDFDAHYGKGQAEKILGK